MMKTLLSLVFAVQLAAGSIASAAAAKNYQVTGPIVSLTDTMIVVQKGDEQWEIACDAKTKADSQLKVGEKVTVYYRMVATNVDVKTTGTLSEPVTQPKASGEKATTKSAANKVDTK